MTPRARRLARLFGMSVADYNRLLKKQRGGCAICQRKPKTRRLAVDHDHSKKGRDSVRGLLCVNCNRFRVAKNDLASADRVADYLNEFALFGNALDRSVL